ncbi:Uncharacterised protein [Vibrio cholerae]|nr:Uncharacterised protein [Vibrio cholerae]CSC67380.1 Uncharacterised protein [Vibrio cholerae]
MVFHQRAKLISQIAWQHGNVATRQINGKATLASNFVHLIFWGDVSGWIGNRDSQRKITVWQLLCVKRVVHIFGRFTIDSHKRQRGQIFTNQVCIIFQLPIVNARWLAVGQIVFR